MINGRVWVILIERIVAGILIGAKQADLVRHRFATRPLCQGCCGALTIAPRKIKDAAPKAHGGAAIAIEIKSN
jgi:hypothetical protein